MIDNIMTAVDMLAVLIHAYKAGDTVAIRESLTDLEHLFADWHKTYEVQS